MERDYRILREIDRWRFCLGRHVTHLCGFGGTRATDRRLKILVDMGYLTRKKVLYGIPSIYQLTPQGRKLISKTGVDTIRTDQIIHQIAVLDTVCYLMGLLSIKTSNIKSEKELHSMDGFGFRKHKPDFVYELDEKTVAVEIERSLKGKTRFEHNVKLNYMNYDEQTWFVLDEQPQIAKRLIECQKIYDGIKVISLKEVYKSGD